jgi:hypothetical protein
MLLFVTHLYHRFPKGSQETIPVQPPNVRADVGDIGQGEGMDIWKFLLRRDDSQEGLDSAGEPLPRKFSDCSRRDLEVADAGRPGDLLASQWSLGLYADLLEEAGEEAGWSPSVC